MKEFLINALLFVTSGSIAFFLGGSKPAAPEKDKTPPAQRKVIRIPSAGECEPDEFIRINTSEQGGTWEAVITKIQREGIREIEAEAGVNTLAAFCAIGDTKAVKAYLESGVNPLALNMPDRNGVTPLAAVLKNMDFDTAEVLIAHGADPRRSVTIDGSEKDPMQIVLEQRGYLFDEDIDRLLELGIFIDRGERYLVQALSSESNKFKLVERILPITNPNARTEAGNHIFAEVLNVSSSRKTIDFFLNTGTRFDNAPAEITLLGAAAANIGIKADDVLKMIKKGADPNQRSTKDLSTPLMAAVKNSRPDIEAVLLKNGANPLLKDIHGKTAEDYRTSHP